MSDDASQVADAAQKYLARDWSVIPLRVAAKRPLIAWEAFQHRRPQADDIADWFGRWPDANLGVVTGAISGLVVLDVDAGHGGDDSLAELERAHGRLPATPEALTGGGGRHIYFAYPGGELRNRAGLAPGLDLRADGGYVVVPPSLHPSGRHYVWRDKRDPESLALAPMPVWLLDLARGPESGHGHPLRYWRVLLREGVGEGARNTTLASLAGHLLWHDVDAEVVRALLLAWNRVRCRPPLEDTEVDAVVASIARLHAREQGDR